MPNRREYRRARYRMLKEQGICTTCESRQAEPGRRLCQRCEEMHRRAHEKHIAQNPDAGAERSRAMRERRWVAGLCVRCGKNPQSETKGYCPDCLAATRVEARKKAPNRKSRYLKKTYGLTPDEWSALLTAQGGRCAICGRKDPGPKGWQTDHDHATGAVRGILCVRCNNGLGAFLDDPILFQRAARYLVIKGGKTGERQATLDVEAS